MVVAGTEAPEIEMHILIKYGKQDLLQEQQHFYDRLHLQRERTESRDGGRGGGGGVIYY